MEPSAGFSRLNGSQEKIETDLITWLKNSNADQVLEFVTRFRIGKRILSDSYVNWFFPPRQPEQKDVLWQTSVDEEGFDWFLLP